MLKTLEVNKQMLPAYLILGEVYSILKDIENTEKHLTKLWNAVWMILLLHFEWGKAYVRFLNLKKLKNNF